MKIYNFGLIGCGNAGRHHVASMKLVENGKFTGVYGAIPEQAKAFSEEHGLKMYNSLEEMLADPSIDIVTICTPSGTHAEIAVQAMLSGKHVVVEKPVALTIEDCKAVVETAKKTGMKCEVISQLRFSDTISAVKNAVDGGYLGKIVNAGVYMKYWRTDEYYDTSDWRGTWRYDGGGALMNQGIHGIDLMRYFMGSPSRISAICKTLAHNIETEDTAAAILEYPNGAVGVIEGTTSVYPGYTRRFEICGTKGSIIMDEDNIVKWDTEAPSPESLQGYKEADGSENDPTLMSVTGHSRQFADIINAVENNVEVSNPATEGAKTVEVILGVYEAAKKKAFIDFNELF